MKNFIVIFITSNFLFLSALSYAESPPLILETDWLDSAVGSQGDVMGARVKDVDKIFGKDITILEISMPLENPDDIDSVKVNFGI